MFNQNQQQHSFILGLLFSFCFAMCTVYVSANLGSRFIHRQETVDQQFALLRGETYLLDDQETYHPEFQNRLLFPIILYIVSKSTLFESSEWYILLRLASAFIMYLLLWHLAQHTLEASIQTSVMGLALTTYCLTFTFNHGWEHPSDFFDYLFFVLFTVFVLKKQYIPILIIVIIASSNRESSAFAGVLWFWLLGFTPTLKPVYREWLRAGTLSLVAYSVVLFLRLAVGGEKALSQQTVTAFSSLLGYINEFVSNPNPFSWLILLPVMFLPIVVWLYGNRAFIDIELKRLIFAAVSIQVISLLFGRIEELRIFIPSVAILIFVCLAAETKRAEASSA